MSLLDEEVKRMVEMRKRGDSGVKGGSSEGKVRRRGEEKRKEGGGARVKDRGEDGRDGDLLDILMENLPAPQPRKVMVSFYIDEDDLRVVDELAHRVRIPRSEVLRSLIRMALRR